MTYLKQFLKKEKEIRNAKIKHKEAIAQLATIVASADREVKELEETLTDVREANCRLKSDLNDERYIVEILRQNSKSYKDKWIKNTSFLVGYAALSVYVVAILIWLLMYHSG